MTSISSLTHLKKIKVGLRRGQAWPCERALDLLEHREERPSANLCWYYCPLNQKFKSEEDKELVKHSYNAYELWDLAENALNDLNDALAKYIKNPASTNNPDIDEIKKFYDKVEATREQAAEIQTSVISFLHSKRYSYSSFIRDEPEAMEA
ncbi:hypothetical protein Tco_0506378 [Tanacetum coccineum]